MIKSFLTDIIFIFLKPVSSDFFALIRNRPALPFHVVNQRVDYNRQPHVIQRYHVPSPRNDQYCRHDQAVYSMWMHFVIFCSMELENGKSHRHAEAEIAAFAHPGYRYPLESAHTLILPSSAKGYQSKNLHTGHQQCFFLEGTLAVNPFTNVSRLDVFKNLSCDEGSQLLFSTRESSSCPSSASSKCASRRESSPAQELLYARAPTDLVYAFSRNDLQPHFSSKDLHILNPHPGICQPLHFDDSFTPCKKHNLTVQHSDFLAESFHPYFNREASTVSAIGLGCKATHLNHMVHTGFDYITSFTVAGAVPKSSKAGIRAFNMEEKGPYDMDEVLKRSLYDLIDVDEASPSLNIARLSPADDNIELSFCDLTDNYLNSSPVASGTPEIKSPPNFEMARPTNISNMSCYNPSSVCSILRGSLRNTPSLNFKSRHLQVYGKQEQLQTKMRQYNQQSERISDQSSIQSQKWQYDKMSDDLGSK